MGPLCEFSWSQRRRFVHLNVHIPHIDVLIPDLRGRYDHSALVIPDFVLGCTRL